MGVFKVDWAAGWNRSLGTVLLSVVCLVWFDCALASVVTGAFWMRCRSVCDQLENRAETNITLWLVGEEEMVGF